MPFFKCLSLMTLLAATSVMANQPATAPLADMTEAQKRYMEELQKSGALAPFSQEYVDEKTKPYHANAQQIGAQSLATIATSLAAQPTGTEALGLEAEPADAAPSIVKAIFVSFSMNRAEIRQAFEEAEQHQAELYFYGMHPDDQNIPQTMTRLRALMKDSKANAKARFHPKAFDEFKITAVPALLIAEPGRVGLSHGHLNFDYLQQRIASKEGLNDIGLIGPTKPVIERNLMDVISERVAALDGEKLKKQAIDNFWKKRQFVSIPAAAKDAEFYIDPTVRVTKDIKNSQGVYLASAGDVLNPLATVPNMNTYILFNALDQRQLEWADRYLKEGKHTGTVMLMTSELNKEQGWDHLSALRQHFSRELYLIPKEMVERFKITGLPAVVTTDMQKRLLKINQYALKESAQ